MTRRGRSATATLLSAAMPAPARLSSLLFLLLAGALIIIGKVDTAVIDTIRRPVQDTVSPVVQVLSQPVTAVRGWSADAVALWQAHTLSKQLKAENEALLRWQGVALALEAENQRLRDLLNVPLGTSTNIVTARTISDIGGIFVRSVLIDAGTAHGVVTGQAAMAGGGYVGRVIDAGRRSARILLLTDLNSRIPVIVQQSGQHGILAGTNDAKARLEHLPQDIEIAVGDRIMTSGTGGVLPPGLPVGTVTAIGSDGILVRPAADLSRLMEVRLTGRPATVSATEPADAAPQPTASNVVQ